MLLRTQQNEVLGLVHARGFAAADFAWQEVDSKRTHEIRVVGRRAEGPGRSSPISAKRGVRVHKLTHEASGFYFLFDVLDEGPRSRYSEYSPSDASIKATNQAGTWERQLDDVRAWLAALWREVTAPDLWEQFRAATEATSLHGMQSDAPFLPHEVDSVAAALSELEERLLDAVTPNHAAMNDVREGVAYLKAELLRQDKRGWRHIFLGVLLTWLVGEVVPPGVLASVGQWVFGRMVEAISVAPGLPGPG